MNNWAFNAWFVRGLDFAGNFIYGFQTGDEVAEVRDVTAEDVVSLEMRFGPGRSQQADRFTV